MREYNRANSDNSIEVWLYPNDTYEFRYGELDIINHDVLIGEQGSTSQIYTYHFFDECNTGTTNIVGTCVSYDWNSSSNAVNTLLEDGGSLYGDGTDQSACVTTPLTSVNCAGYAAAYLAQQCSLNSLYDESCSGYATAYLAQQCGLNALYDSECSGYAVAYLAQQCGLSSLYDSSCTGYEEAYLAQQCGLDDLYATTCPNYDTAYDDQQCENDPQYSPSCQGYTQTESVAYYEETEEIDYGYTTEYDDDPYAGMEVTDQERYETDVQEFGQEFGQELVDEGYGTDAEQEAIWVTEELLWQEEQNRIQEEQFIAEEEHIIIEEPQWETEEIWVEEPMETTLVSYVIEEIEAVEVEEHFEIETEESVEVLEIFDAEELVELYEFETIIREELEQEENVVEIETEREEELELLVEENIEEEESIETEEEELAQTESEKKTKKGGSARISALEVVANTIRIAGESVTETVGDVVTINETSTVELTEDTEDLFTSSIGITSNNPVALSISDYFSGGSSTSAVNYGAATNNTTTGVGGGAAATATSTNLGVTTSSSSNVGISTTNSPSISDQFVSSSAQTQEVLTMSVNTMETGTTTGVVGSETMSTSSSVGSTVTMSITPLSTFDSTPQVVMADVQVTDMQGEIDTAIGGVMTASEADQIADKIIAQNIKEQQEEGQTTQEETGQYGDESTLVAFLGYVPGFDAYREATIPQATTWYEPRAIYADASISDNISAFYGLASTNLNKMQAIIQSQPTL